MAYNHLMKKRKLETPEFFDFPKIRRRRFLKTVIALSFFIGGNILNNKINYEKPLPYKDNQELPQASNQNNNEIIEEIEMQFALEAYEHLLKQLYQKSFNLGVPLTNDYLIKIISYDNMTDTIEVVLQNENKTVVLKFPSKDLEKIVMQENLTLSDQISELAILLNSPLLELPAVNSFNSSLNQKLNNKVASGIKYYANTNVQFSDGNDRNELMSENLLQGRDYHFFNVYGKGYKNNVEYDVVTIVSMTADDYEILGAPALIDYYLNNPEDSRFTVNIFYQENQRTIAKLNQQKQINNTLEK
jgi:hypothetical protein